MKQMSDLYLCRRRFKRRVQQKQQEKSTRQLPGSDADSQQGNHQNRVKNGAAVQFRRRAPLVGNQNPLLLVCQSCSGDSTACPGKRTEIRRCPVTRSSASRTVQVRGKYRIAGSFALCAGKNDTAHAIINTQRLERILSRGNGSIRQRLFLPVFD
ncbi:hypothetical protein OBBRIDRAFT_349449 [Obba rivulosa]|uniref:Uncharacterized protein n=1 Tax=Obba rivulosa TaxID=1052685 RepID=A0A8E2B1R7_9APHY|nr:hypothetical protein OBBRIDRAFT_349449 [Obba rivulosa]